MYTHKPARSWLILVFTFFLCPLALLDVSAQNNILQYPDLYYRTESLLLENPAYHSVLHPQYLSVRQKQILMDSLYGRPNYLITYQKRKTTLTINPVLQSSFRTGPKFLQHTAAGFMIESELSPKFTLDLTYSFHLLTNHAFPNTRLDSAGMVSYWGKASEINNSLLSFHSFTGKITYTPNRFLSFQLGNDKHFWGDGNRSMFLSDNAPAYPYFATTLTVWKLKYTHIVMLLRDDTIGNYAKLKTKYASMHMLSWNVNRKLNLNFFEAVVWRHRNDSLQRGLSLNYVNPFIFLRPVEYNLGSPDNVLIGFGAHYMVSPQTMIYGQLMFDEFYYKDMIKANGWWANKYAYQLGFKCFNLLQVKDLYLQMEYNQARPFTYGHSYVLQNYGYLLQPMAHPLGTNFREGSVIVRYYKNKWFINAVGSVYTYGAEPGGKPMGGDIYLSSNKFAKTFGNYIGQGIRTNGFEQELTISRILQSSWGLIAEAGIHNTFTTLPDKQQHMYITFGIKTLLYREEKLF